MSQTPLGNHIGMLDLFLKKQFMETDCITITIHNNIDFDTIHP